MASDVQCDLCQRTVPLHESFVLKMDVYADPSMPPMNSEQVESAWRPAHLAAGCE
jgi:hypothetical protein